MIVQRSRNKHELLKGLNNRIIDLKTLPFFEKFREYSNKNSHSREKNILQKENIQPA